MKLNSYYTGFFLVFFAGLFWSFGAPTVRHMINGEQYVFHYLFYRGLAISSILIFYLFIKEGFYFYKNFLKIGVPSILGGIFLSTAFIGFIFSINMTSKKILLFLIFISFLIFGSKWIISYYLFTETTSTKIIFESVTDGYQYFPLVKYLAIFE